MFSFASGYKLYLISTAKNITVTVIMINTRDSAILRILFYRNLLRRTFTKLLTLMKKAPTKPPKKPRIAAATNESRVGDSYWAPNFIISVFETVIG